MLLVKRLLLAGMLAVSAGFGMVACEYGEEEGIYEEEEGAGIGEEEGTGEEEGRGFGE